MSQLVHDTMHGETSKASRHVTIAVLVLPKKITVIKHNE
jgi:hypothetical protein